MTVCESTWLVRFPLWKCGWVFIMDSTGFLSEQYGWAHTHSWQHRRFPIWTVWVCSHSQWTAQISSLNSMGVLTLTMDITDFLSEQYGCAHNHSWQHRFSLWTAWVCSHQQRTAQVSSLKYGWADTHSWQHEKVSSLKYGCPAPSISQPDMVQLCCLLTLSFRGEHSLFHDHVWR